MKKTMLFVDDRSKRIHAALLQYSCEYDVTIAPNVSETLRLLCAQPWDVVSLDHDLTGCDFEDPDTPTCGMEVARYIQKTGWPFSWEPEWIVHSSNAFGAHALTVALQRLDFRHVRQERFTYPVEHMTYDKDGLPK